jgi:fibro-slime domain-containing protein
MLRWSWMLLVWLAACGSRSGIPAGAAGEPCDDAGATRACASVCGSGIESCVGGVWRDCTAPRPRPPELVGTVRDFRDDHPDFESAIGSDPGIVEPLLGADGKPVYASSGTTATTHGKSAFDQWYRDVPGVNLARPLALPLTRASGGADRFVYDDQTFFPIDGELYGNQGRSHNFHFTFEVATAFMYRGGETFSFTGDDDLWVFINRRLVIDLGGVHGAEHASVDLDLVAPQIGLSAGQTHSLHLFFAERHSTESRFRLRTSISELELCD